jgi:hypothetical protein
MKSLLFSAMTLSLVCANAQETGKLTIEIPAAVQQTIAREKGESGKVIEFKRLNENDGATYAITLEIDGKPYEMILDGAARVMRKELVTSESEEKEIDVHQLPEAIKKTFYREATGVALKVVRVRDEKKKYFANIVINRRKYVIEVDAAGKLVAKRFEGDAEEN